MSKVKDFFANLKKSTKITLVSCGCFIAMTALILCFFIMFPITPSEKVIASFGRESVLKKDSTTPAGSTVTTMNGVEVSKGSSNKLSTVTTKRVTRRNNFSMDVTTGSGFFSGGNILTGNCPVGSLISGSSLFLVIYSHFNLLRRSLFDPIAVIIKTRYIFRHIFFKYLAGKSS